MSEAKAKPGWRVVIRALGQRKTGYMLLFGFAAGLPYALLLGTLYAWLSDAKVDLETMGVFSLIGLAYAFKFLWSPALDRIDLPLLHRLGKRKQWKVDTVAFRAIGGPFSFWLGLLWFAGMVVSAGHVRAPTRQHLVVEARWGRASLGAGAR